MLVPPCSDFFVLDSASSTLINIRQDTRKLSSAIRNNEGKVRLACKTRFDVNCSILFTELDILRRPAAAAEAGFDAVELWWPWASAVPADRDVDALGRAIDSAGVLLVGLNFIAGDMAGGDRGLLSWPGRSAEFRDNVDVAVGFGASLGCRCFNALYGNRIEGVSQEEQDELALENLELAAEAARRVGAVVALEALSGPQPYPLRTTEDCLAVVQRLSAGGVRNVKLLADLYHITVNGEDPFAAIRARAEHFAHVQVADVPGRHEPGSGELDVAGLLLQLEASSYSGWVGLEYVPSTSSEESLRWLPLDRRGSGRFEREGAS